MKMSPKKQNAKQGAGLCLAWEVFKKGEAEGEGETVS